VRSYEKAAKAVGGYPDDLAALPESALTKVPGVGKSGAAKIRTEDLRGDLHTHTDLTDGIVSLEGMIAAAEARGYEYYAVTDHAPNLVMQRMTDEKMLAQRDELCVLADTAGMALLHGTELNIAPDGSVDWDEDFLRGFDMCVASVQTHDPIPKRENPRVRFTIASRRPGRTGCPGGIPPTGSAGRVPSGSGRCSPRPVPGWCPTLESRSRNPWPAGRVTRCKTCPRLLPSASRWSVPGSWR
jgi:hypothetical protein